MFPQDYSGKNRKYLWGSEIIPYNNPKLFLKGPANFVFSSKIYSYPMHSLLNLPPGREATSKCMAVCTSPLKQQCPPV